MNFIQLASTLPEDVREKLFARLDEVHLSSSCSKSETRAKVEDIANDLRLEYSFDPETQHVANALSQIPNAIIEEIFQGQEHS